MPFDFPFTINNIEDVPEKYRVFYERTGEEGDFFLDEELHAKITKLVESLEKERKRSKDATKEAKAWSELGPTPDAVKQQIEELKQAHAQEIEDLKKLIDEKGDAKEKFDKLRQELVKAHAEELAQRDALVAEMEATLRKHLVESAAKTAIAEAKGKVKPLLPYVLQKIDMVKENGTYRAVVLDDDGEPRLTRDGKEMDIRGLVEELKADPEFQPLFEATPVSGSGARQSSSGSVPGISSNPWNPKSRNLTEQMRLERENPALAARLKQQAAVA
jgi:hypothetical protein